MTRTYFKSFADHVQAADMKDEIWWAGYLWIDLSVKQFNTVYHILESKGFEKNENGTILLPSGLGIKQPQEG